MTTIDKYIRTRKCGCGECRFKPKTVICPLENAPDARWLWATNPEYLKSKTFLEEPSEPQEEPATEPQE